MTSVLSTHDDVSLAGAVNADTPGLRKANYYTLDGWRGLAALAVVAYHAGLVIVNKKLDGQTTSLYSLCEFGFLGVQVFFVISGYCIAASGVSVIEKAKPSSVFLKARLKRLYPPAWASMVLVVALVLAASYLASRGIVKNSSAGQGPTGSGVLYWVSNLTLTQIFFGQAFVSPVLWTLCYEVAFYAVVLLAVMARRMYTGSEGLLWVIHGVTIASLVTLLVVPGKVPFPFDLWPQFGYGVIVYDLRTSRIRTRGAVAAALVGLLSLAFVLKSDTLLTVMGIPSRLSYLTAAGFAALAWLLKPADEGLSSHRAVRILRYLGYFSYSLYLTHFLVLGVVNQAMGLVFRSADYHYVQFVLSLLAAVVFARLFFQVAERPWLNTGRQS